MNNFFNCQLLKLCRIALILICVNMNGYAQTFNFKTSEASGIRNGRQLYYHHLPDTITVWCNEWNDIITHPSTWKNDFKFKSKNSFVKFGIDNFYPVSQAPYTYQLIYQIYGYYKDPALDSTSYVLTNDTLTISNFNHSDPHNAYQDIQMAHFSGYYKTMVVITGIINYSGFGYANLTDSTRWNFNIESSLLTQKYDKTYYGIGASLECTETPYPADNYLDVSFHLPGGSSPVLLTPVNYELEWTYVDNYSRDPATGSISSIPAGSLQYDFEHNSTRVWLDSSHYRIPLAYPEGYLVYRVRMVRPDSTLFKYPLYSAWSYSTPGTGSVSSANSNVKYQITDAFSHDSLNWQYSVSFAEGGRYKHVGSFYDGLLKNRESITRFNSNLNKLIVTKNIYDFEGHQAIKTLPAPVSSSAFSFQQGVDLNSVTNMPYRSNDFDTGFFHICPGEPTIAPLGNLALANIYYSQMNSDTAGVQKYVPDAEGYPLVQTIYSPGYNDRVDKQGGAGKRLQMTDSNIITNMYVTTQQGLLNSLFGMNVGWNEFYNMTVTRDPNMQYSMSVKDYEGRQIATAMIGTGPNGVDHAIDAINAPGAWHTSEDILAGAHQEIKDNMRICDKEFFNATSGTDSIQYKYTFTPYPVCPSQFLSVQAHYYYEVTDQCGNFIYSQDSTLGLNGVISHPVTFAGSVGSLHMEPTQYTVHKELSISQADVNDVIDSFIAGPNCLLTKHYFIRKSMEKQNFPCPEPPDPCVLKRKEMMEDLMPGGPYGQFRDSAGYVRADLGHSIFAYIDTCIECPHNYVYQDTCIMNHIPDTIRVKGVLYRNLHKMPVDSFMMVYNLANAAGNYTIAEALLPLHPEFCMGCIYDTFKTMLLGLPNQEIAEKQHLLLLDSIIAHDPVTPLIPGSGADSLAYFPGGLMRLDHIMLMKIYCGCADHEMSGKCLDHIFKYEIDNNILLNDYVKKEYFDRIISSYVANRQRFVDDYLYTHKSDSCSHCATLRLLPHTPLDGPGGTGFPPMEIYDSLRAFGDTSSFWILDGMYQTTIDSAQWGKRVDSVHYISAGVHRSLCSGSLDTLITRLNNCNSGDPALLNAIKLTLDSMCTAGVHDFKPSDIRYAIEVNGGHIDDFCNPYLVAYGTIEPDPAPGTETCLEDSFYIHTKDFLGRGAVIGALSNPGTVTYDILDPVYNLFMHSLYTVLGGSNAHVRMKAAYNTGTDLYTLTIYGDPSWGVSADTARVYLHGTGMGGCANIFGGGVGHTYTIRDVKCINEFPKAFVSGLINQYSFITTVMDNIGTVHTTCTMLGWTDTIETMASRTNLLAACMPCTQMRSLFNEFSDTMATLKVLGPDHPFYARMLFNFISSKIGQKYTADQYLKFIESCALADTVLMPLYVGYSNGLFANTDDADSFINFLNTIDTNCDFTNSFRDSSAAGITVSIDYGMAPMWEAYKYRDAIRTYAAPHITIISDTALSYLQGPGNIIGRIYADSGTVLPSPATIFGPGGTLRYSAMTQRGIWLGNGYIPMDSYDLIDSPGTTPPYEVSEGVYEIQRYFFNNKVPALFISNYRSTANPDYFKPHKRDFLHYNYQYQQLPPYRVLDSIQAKYLEARITSFNYHDVSYNTQFNPNVITNLYIADTSMGTRLMDTLVYMMNYVQAYNPVSAGHICYDTNKVIVIPAPGPSTGPPLMAYRCSDGTYWYRYFGKGDTMYNAYVAMPKWIPRSWHKQYSIISVGPPAGITPALGDSVTRYFTLNMRRAGDTAMIQARGLTNFVIAHNEELDNVLLGNPLTTHQAQTPLDTFHNCERDLTDYAVRQGILNHLAYLDSVRYALRARVMDYMLKGVHEELILGFINQQFSYTLYNYDRAGNLHSTVPPGGVTPIGGGGVDGARTAGIAPPILLPPHSKVSSYDYNSINQVVKQNTPDAGNTFFWYDAAGRLVFSQNSLQQTKGNVTYNLYDHQNRIIETGEAALMCSPNFAEYTGYDTTTIFPTCYYTYPLDTRLRTYTISPISPPVRMLNYITHDSIIKYIHSIRRTDVVTTIYDTALTDLSKIPGMEAQQNLRKRVTAVQYFRSIAPVGASPYEYTSHYSYDANGNVKVLVQDCPQLEHIPLIYDGTRSKGPKQMRYKRIDYDYDLISGKVSLLSYNRSFADQYYQRYSYDDDNRITKVETSSDGYIWKRDAEYTYYQHGPLARAEIGDMRVQGIDYAYTISGWLKTMNGDTLNSFMDIGQDAYSTINAQDAAAFTIDYFKGDYKPINGGDLSHTAQVQRNLYNGNISRETSMMGDFYRLNKQYAYDQLNRIHTADYSVVDPVTKALTGIDDYKSRYSYDEDGNITSLLRYGNDKGTGAHAMDSMKYNYGLGLAGFSRNQLMTLQEYAANGYGNDILQNTPLFTPNYKYNEIGNTVQDYVSTGPWRINWNLYNKVTVLDTADLGGIIHHKESFDYDGAGNRTAKHIYGSDPEMHNKTDEYYVRDAQGNILAIYKGTDEYKRDWVSTIGVIRAEATTGTFTGTTGWTGGGSISPWIYRHDILKVWYGDVYFKDYIMARAEATPSIRSGMLGHPMSWYLSSSPVLYSKMAHADAAYIAPLVAADRAGTDTVVGPALAAMTAERPYEGTKLITWLLEDSTLKVHTLSLLCAAGADSVLLAVAKTYGIDTTVSCDTLAMMLADRYSAEELGEAIVTKSGLYPGPYGEFMRLVAIDTALDSRPLYSTPSSSYVGLVKTAVADFADRGKVMAYFDAAAISSALAAGHVAGDHELMSYAYDKDPGAVLDAIDASLGTLTLDTALAHVPGLGPGDLYWHIHDRCVCDYRDPTGGYVTTLNKVVFGLAEHDIYGSLRLGTKNYLPSQIGLRWDSVLRAADTVRLWERKPWYSAEYQDVIQADSLQPYGATQTDKTIVSHLSGQKQYELTDLRGDVLVTVSDARTINDTVVLDTIGYYKPVVQSAYDYYPFGMMMPGRNTQDSNTHCVTLSETKLFPSISTKWHPADVIDISVYSGGTTTSVFTGGGGFTGGGVVVTEATADDYAHVSLTGFPVGLEQHMSLVASNVTRSFGFQIIQDDTMMLAAYEIPMAAEVSIPMVFTPTTSHLVGRLILPGGGGIGGGGIVLRGYWYSDTAYYPRLVVTNECSDGLYRYGHNGKFKDNEWAGIGNHYDFGARLYDTRIGRWLSTDPLFHKFRNVSPYNFALNSPLGLKDDDGRDIIILSAPRGAGGFGHAAVLIGNDKDHWFYYSKNGTYGSSGSAGPSNKNPRSGIEYKSLKDFANSIDNVDEKGRQEYLHAYRIATSQGQDAYMKWYAARQIMSDYRLLNASCIDVASDALKSVGKNPGYEIKYFHGGGHFDHFLEPGPNVRYRDIMNTNKGKDVTNDITPSSKSNDNNSGGGSGGGGGGWSVRQGDGKGGFQVETKNADGTSTITPTDREGNAVSGGGGSSAGAGTTGGSSSSGATK